MHLKSLLANKARQERTEEKRAGRAPEVRNSKSRNQLRTSSRNKKNRRSHRQTSLNSCSVPVKAYVIPSNPLINPKIRVITKNENNSRSPSRHTNHHSLFCSLKSSCCFFVELTNFSSDLFAIILWNFASR